MARPAAPAGSSASRSRRARMRGLLLAALAAAAAGGAQAQVREVRIEAPRSVGYTVGDLVRTEVVVDVDAGWTLRPASLPRPREAAYWLELREVGVERERLRGGGTRYRVPLTWQSFYVPLGARELALPGFVLEFEHAGGQVARAEVPAWAFTMSPLREILPPGQRRPDTRVELLPDAVPAPAPLRPLLLAAAGLLVLALAAALLWAWQRAAWPFRARPARPFARSAREVARVLRGADARGYPEALRQLHRGFDASAGRRLLAADVPAWLASRPGWRGLGADIAAYFEASRLAFFAGDATAAATRLPPDRLRGLARALAAHERRGA